MEKLDYKKSLNKNVIYDWYAEALIQVFMGYSFYLWSGWWIVVGIIWQIYFLAKTLKGYKEKKEIKNTIAQYNDYVELYTFSLVENKLRDEYCIKAKLRILDNYAKIWKPQFIYEDEEQVYKSSKGDAYIASGYFRYIRYIRYSGTYRSKECKAKYSIIFKDGEHYMSNIDNLVLPNYKGGLPILYKEVTVYNGVDLWLLLIWLLFNIALLYSFIR